MVPLSHPVFLNQVTAHFRAVTIVHDTRKLAERAF